MHLLNRALVRQKIKLDTASCIVIVSTHGATYKTGTVGPNDSKQPTTLKGIQNACLWRCKWGNGLTTVKSGRMHVRNMTRYANTSATHKRVKDENDDNRDAKARAKKQKLSTFVDHTLSSMMSKVR